mgnify:CR=1 FL=1
MARCSTPCRYETADTGYLSQFGLHITDQDYAVTEGFSQPQVAEYFLKRYPNLPLTQQQMLDGMDEMITSRYESIAKPKDGVIDFLESLRARGIKMAIATLTARRHAEKALIDRDMMKYFEFMLTIEDVGVLSTSRTSISKPPAASA